jgi:hypothetical protein
VLRPCYRTKVGADMELNEPNNCVQATPDCAFLFFLCQGSATPDAER